MSISDAEAGVAALFSGPAVQADAESLTRYIPKRRNDFDNFIFKSTRWALDDGAPDSFSFACNDLQNTNQSTLPGTCPVPLIPQRVSDVIDEIISEWQPGTDPTIGNDLNRSQANLRNRLYLHLGGDLGDGVAAAGRRLSSRMWSARIADGFVHPAVGGFLWHGNAGKIGEDSISRLDPPTAAIYTVGDLIAQWWAEELSRPVVEREILDLTYTLGWPR